MLSLRHGHESGAGGRFVKQMLIFSHVHGTDLRDCRLQLASGMSAPGSLEKPVAVCPGGGLLLAKTKISNASR